MSMVGGDGIVMEVGFVDEARRGLLMTMGEILVGSWAIRNWAYRWVRIIVLPWGGDAQ